MAAMNLQEDQTTGTFLLRPNLWTRFLGAAGNIFWLALVVAFFLLPALGGGRPNIESLVILIIVVLFSFIPSLGAFVFTTFSFERTSRTLSRTTSIFFLPIRTTTTSFTDLETISVEFYRQSSGRSAHDAYRVVAREKSGGRIPLNWDGKRDEMLALGQKISALTGAEMRDQTDQPASTLTQIIEAARDLGLPIPAPQTSQRADDAADTTETSSPYPDAIAPEPIAEPAAMVDDSTPAEPPTRDLTNLSVNGLEKMAAADSSDSDARYILARAYHAEGKIDRAIAMYQETLKIDTSNAEAQNDLGVALYKRGKRADAEAAYRRAIALDPFSFNAHLNLALLLRAMNRATEASAEFLQARQNAQGSMEKQIAENASSGMKVEARLSGER